MATARCCPADCALRSDWEEELGREEVSLSAQRVSDLGRYMKLLSHPIRLKVLLLLLNRDHCVCEFMYIFTEPPNLVSYNLGVLKKGGLVETYYRSNHRIYTIARKAEPIVRRISTAIPE
ncbi:MAG TPA: winged helix-turn-helix domain-containing protein [Methanoregulaceae archaeon]|nr:winged helix-turn-helix domain-containing protein [Methanoregulaceae archaeon]